MNATEQALQKIEELQPDSSLSVEEKAKVTAILDKYYQSKGTMEKNLPVNLILETLNLKFSEYGAKIAECLK